MVSQAVEGTDPSGHEDPRDPGPKRDLSGLVDLLGTVVAPSTLITGLAFYFGVKFQETRAGRVGIDVSLLGFSTQDYVLRSTDVVVPALLVLVLIALGALQVHRLVRRRLTRPYDEDAFARAARGLVVLGACGLLVGTLSVFFRLPFRMPFLVRPISLGVGVILLAYGGHLAQRIAWSPTAARRRTREERLLSMLGSALIVILVLVSLLLATAEYAQALGRGKADQLIRQLDRRPSVVIYSAQRLHLAGPGVGETVLDPADAAYRFRYEGLRLLVRSGGHYFLLPEGWSRRSGNAIVLPVTDALRLELRPGAGS
jgi:uncharacterized membrane protein YidH (DUF202 family)